MTHVYPLVSFNRNRIEPEPFIRNKLQVTPKPENPKPLKLQVVVWKSQNADDSETMKSSAAALLLYLGVTIQVATAILTYNHNQGTYNPSY